MLFLYFFFTIAGKFDNVSLGGYTGNTVSFLCATEQDKFRNIDYLVFVLVPERKR